MSDVKIHKLSNADSRDGERRPISDEIARSIRLSESFLELLKEIELSSETGIILISLDDGPVVAAKLLNLMEQNKFVDNLVPVYTLDTAASSGCLLWGRLKDYKGPNGRALKDPAALSAFYDAKDGTSVINSIETLMDVNNKQATLSVRFPTAKIPTIQYSLDHFGRDATLDLGFVEDKAQQGYHEENFIQLSGKISDNDEKINASGLLTQILRGAKDSSYTPLRTAEIVRASILGIIERNDRIERPSLLKRLDGVYRYYSHGEENLRKVVSSIDKKNEITDNLLSQLTRAEIIKTVYSDGTGIGKKRYMKGSSWNSNDVFMKPYLSYYAETIKAKVFKEG